VYLDNVRNYLVFKTANIISVLFPTKCLYFIILYFVFKQYVCFKLFAEIYVPISVGQTLNAIFLVLYDFLISIDIKRFHQKNKIPPDNFLVTVM
jgi:hypothetical protein